MRRLFPFLLPADFLERIGWPPVLSQQPAVQLLEMLGMGLTDPTAEAARARVRYVGFHWECCGDELAWDDGTTSGAGFLNHWEWLKFFHRAEVTRWLHVNGYDLGSSENPEKHWLVVNLETRRYYIADKATARAIVQQQRLHPE